MNCNLDVILKETGEFGRFQVRSYVLIIFPIMLSAGFSLNYVFTTRNVNYRCIISECEPSVQPGSIADVYSPSWLQHAVPYQRNNELAQCERYKYQQESNKSAAVPTSNDNNRHDSGIDGVDSCDVARFDNTSRVRCSHYVFEGDNSSIVSEFGITCPENEWKLALIGTINNIAQFISLPVAGYVSDRFGRRTLLIVGTLLAGVFGICKSLTTSYAWFFAMEFLCGAAASGIYSAAFILGVELVGPKKRALGGTLISCYFPFGGALLGYLAMKFPSWRTLLLIVYAPSVLIISFIWLVPESVRWLLAKGHVERAKEILKAVAKTNKCRLNDEALEKMYNGDEERNNAKCINETTNVKDKFPLLTALKSREVFLRVLNCSFCWVTNTLIYYGLSLNSVNFAGNKYHNFILVNMAEIPGYVLTVLVMDRYGRRKSLCISLLLSGLLCIASPLASDEHMWIGLALFLGGKCAITVSFTVLYVFTTELFPTSLRHTLMSACSMMGRFGSMAAPQTPLLGRYMKSLPLFIFGGSALTSGLLCLCFPETQDTSLPDTVEEAAQMGKSADEED